MKSYERSNHLGNVKTIFLVFSVILLVTFGCIGDKDKYYREIREFGLIRVPAIYPTYLGSTEGLKGPWFVFESYSSEGSMEVTSIDILDSVIVAFYFNKWIRVLENRDTTWHIISPSKKTAYRFENEKKFIAKLSTITNKKPNFREPSDIWLEFKDKGYLNWFPVEYKPKFE